MGQNEIFVSYAWKGESEALVNQLCEAFAANGYTISRDRNAMTYKDSIRDFMNRIGRGKFIIAVISDKYMKSEYCMYEAYRLFQSPAFRERVFPIVLQDADITTFRGQASYLKYWNEEYKALESEYKEIAQSSPTMVGPLTERLRDIEATTRFINDFMSAIADMNVLTSQLHLESNFSQLIESIEKRIQLADRGAPDELDSERSASANGETRRGRPAEPKGDYDINTGGGAYVGGSVNTQGGDFIGRDRIVYGDEIRGEGGRDLAAAFAKLRQALDVKADSPEKMMAAQAIKGMEEEAKKGENASEENTRKWLQFLSSTLPDIGEVAVNTFINPIKGLSTVFQKIAERAKEEKENPRK